MSFLRKQESRLLCAYSWGPGGPSGTLISFLDSRLRGNDTLGLARPGRGELLHSAKMLPLALFRFAARLWAGFGWWVGFHILPIQRVP